MVSAMQWSVQCKCKVKVRAAMAIPLQARSRYGHEPHAAKLIHRLAARIR